MKRRAKLLRSCLPVAVLLALAGPAKDATADLRGGARGFGRAMLGSQRQFGSFHFSFGRPSYFARHGTHFHRRYGLGRGSFGLNAYPYAYFTYYAPSYYSPSYFVPAYNLPTYYDSAYYAPAPARPTIIFKVNADDIREDRGAPGRVAPLSGEENDYYLYRKPAPKPEPALTNAIEDIEDAFRTGDIALLEKHVRPADNLRVVGGDQAARQVSGADYMSLTRDALKEMKTASFKLERVEPAADGIWRARGIHRVRFEEGKEKSYTVEFLLRKDGEVWMVTQVGAEPAPSN